MNQITESDFTVKLFFSQLKFNHIELLLFLKNIYTLLLNILFITVFISIK